MTLQTLVLTFASKLASKACDLVSHIIQSKVQFSFIACHNKQQCNIFLEMIPIIKTKSTSCCILLVCILFLKGTVTGAKSAPKIPELKDLPLFKNYFKPILNKVIKGVNKT